MFTWEMELWAACRTCSTSNKHGQPRIISTFSISRLQVQTGKMGQRHVSRSVHCPCSKKEGFTNQLRPCRQAIDITHARVYVVDVRRWWLISDVYWPKGLQPLCVHHSLYTWRHHKPKHEEPQWQTWSAVVIGGQSVVRSGPACQNWWLIRGNLVVESFLRNA
jgi:hypothetical protein